MYRCLVDAIINKNTECKITIYMVNKLLYNLWYLIFYHKIVFFFGRCSFSRFWIIKLKSRTIFIILMMWVRILNIRSRIPFPSITVQTKNVIL